MNDACSKCSLTRDERMAYPQGCPFKAPEVLCPWYDHKTNPFAEPVTTGACLSCKRWLYGALHCIHCRGLT